MKKILISMTVVLATTLLLTGCGKKKEEPKNDVKSNTEENVIKDQEVDGLKMTNTSLTITNGISTLVTEVSNNTGVDYQLEEFTITIKDKDGNVLATLPGYVGETIENGSTKTIDSSIDIDLSNATSVEYEIKK